MGVEETRAALRADARHRAFIKRRDSGKGVHKPPETRGTQDLAALQARDHERQGNRRRALPEIPLHATCPECLRLTGGEAQCTSSTVYEFDRNSRGLIMLVQRELTTCTNDSGETVAVLQTKK